MKKFFVAGLCIIGLLILMLVAGHHQDRASTASAFRKNYVALGDSVAAGVGLANYADSSACDRTTEAYPNVVAQKLRLNLTNLSCSGATMSTGIQGQQNVNQLMVSAQLDQLFHQPRPDLISLTIGANDIHWTTFIARCYSGSCGSAEDTAAVNGLLTEVSSNLQTVLSQIRDHYKGQPPHVVVTGYHQVFPVTATTCSDLSGIDTSEMAWGRQQQASLNKIITDVTRQYSFTRFAAIDFSGHELCSADSWVQGISDSAPYHPKAAGQAEYAAQVIAASKSFKEPIVKP